MLELRPTCECCGKALAPSEAGAFICSFECTFCRDCAVTRLDLKCPNCGGGLLARPTRAPDLLLKYPAGARRITRSEPCPQGAAARSDLPPGRS